MKSRTLAPVAFFLVTVAVAACGSSESEPRLCGEADEGTRVCDSGSELIDLRSAEAMAREVIGEEAVLFSVASSVARSVGHDGFAVSWDFRYRRPNERPPETAWRLTVTADDVRSNSALFYFPSDCTPEESLELLDSRAVVPDAVRRLERTDNPVRLREGGRLSVQQFHDCWYFTMGNPPDYPIHNAVAYVGMMTWSMLEYDEKGRFVALFMP